LWEDQIQCKGYKRSWKFCFFKLCDHRGNLPKELNSRYFKFYYLSSRWIPMLFGSSFYIKPLVLFLVVFFQFDKFSSSTLSFFFWYSMNLLSWVANLNFWLFILWKQISRLVWFWTRSSATYPKQNKSTNLRFKIL